MNADEAAVVAAQIEIAAKETDAGACCAAVMTSKTKCSLGPDTSSKFGLLLRLKSGNTISTCSFR